MPVQSFEQLVGAAGDVKELEYISALHQTDCDKLRRDCSIKADDIRLFLQSRYGVEVDKETVHSVIIGAADSGGTIQMDDDEEVIDLMELVALLMIPTLLKARLQEFQQPLPEGVIKTPDGLLEYVLKMMLHDTTGSSIFKPLNADLLRHILVSYGEDDLAENDELILNMMASTNGATELDTQAFADALTGDINRYDVSNEVRPTTLYEDASVADEQMDLSLQGSISQSFGDLDAESAVATTLATQEQALESSKQSTKRDFLFMRKWMAPSIDVTADLYRSKVLVVFLWATIVISYFAYVWLGERFRLGRDCECRVLFNYTNSGTYIENSDVIMCQLSFQVIKWLVIFTLIGALGLVLVTLGSIGNYVGSPWWQSLVGGVIVLLFSVIPFYLDMQRPVNTGNETAYKMYDPIYVAECSSEANDTSRLSRLENQYLATMALVLGITTASIHFLQAFTSFVPPRRFQMSSQLKMPLPAATIVGVIHTKQAMSLKLADMTKNALDIMRVNDESASTLSTHFAQGLGEFAKSGRRYRTMGGFLWTWKNLWNKDAFLKHGIWLSTRMISSNIAQWIVTLYVLFRGVKLTKQVAADFDDEVTKQIVVTWTGQMIDNSADDTIAAATTTNAITLIRDYLTASGMNLTALDCPSGSATELFDKYCSAVGQQYDCNPPRWTPACALLTDMSELQPLQAEALFDASSVDLASVENATYTAMQQATGQAFGRIYPTEQYMVTIPVAVAAIIAFFTAVYLSLAYIPSVCKTILMLRCGAIKTMRDPKFIQYRQAPDQVSILTGSLFWGAYFSSILVGATIGLVIFFFLWQGTFYFAQHALALVVGFLTITIVRITLVGSCRCSMYKAFYRKRPALANFTLLALEWTNFALSAGFIFVRMIKLLLAAAASIGRVDRRFLAPDVGRFGCIELDNYPIVHTKDILSHEAHRHPYIELLGVIYLMKLRFRGDFGNTAGSTWRLLFVYSLFPWLHKYRMKARPKLLRTTRSNVSETSQASTTRLQYLSIRRVVDTAIYGGFDDDDDDDDDNDDTDDHEPLRADSTDGEDISVDVSTPAPVSTPPPAESPLNSERGYASSLVTSASFFCPAAFLGMSSNADEERIQELEAEVARLKRELAASNGADVLMR